MTGVLLAGGNGTRLLPLTRVVNKHLLPVYNRLMIDLPIKTLVDLGCNEIVIVSGGENIGGFAEYLGDGSAYGVRFTYRVQPEADGVAGALLCAEGLVNGVFPVILGDNYFELPPELKDKPTIYLKEVSNPERFGVYDMGVIIEKPEKPDNNQAVVGFYLYNDSVFDFVRTLSPSKRGELEITDVNNWYIRNGASVEEYDGYWSDMGTFDTLLEVAEHIHG
jgi:glucose-1-phosphate thymidylyltransferase